MKKVLISFLFCTLYVLSINAQCNWLPLGPDDASQINLRSAGRKSMALNSSNTPYLAYSDNNLGGRVTVEKLSGFEWIDVGMEGFTPGPTEYISLAIDASGTPYVAYQDSANNAKATVMKYDGSNWVTVGTAGFSAGTASYISLAIDAKDVPYVAYSDAGNGKKVTVMKFNGTSWDTVGTAGFSTGEIYATSLVVDKSGIPYIAYCDKGNSSNAIVKKYNGTSWEEVGTGGLSTGGANFCSLVLDKSGTPYIAYRDWGNGSKATVKKYDGTNWVAVGSAGFSAGPAWFTSLAINSSDTLYVGYSDEANGKKATVMKYDGMNWVTLGVAGFSAGEADDISFVISSSGSDNTPYLAYSDKTNGSKATVKKFFGIWKTTGYQVLSTADAKYTSLAFGADGAYLAYRDSSNRDNVTVRKYDGSQWKDVGIINDTAIVSYISLSIDKSNIQYIAYCDEKNEKKITVKKHVGSDDTTPWDTVGNTGFSTGKIYSTSLATDASGTPYVAYCDSGIGNNVIVKKYNGTSWEEVGAGGVSTAGANFCSLVLDKSGTPYLAYRDWGNGKKVTVKKLNGTSWETVGNAGFSSGPAWFISLVIDPSGTPYVGYSDEANGKKAAVKKYDGTNWIDVGAADLSQGEADYISLAISTSGKPYLAYQDWGNGKKAKVMKYNGSNWVAMGSVGASDKQTDYISLAINKSGIPYLAFSEPDRGAYVFKSSDLFTLQPIIGEHSVCAGTNATYSVNALYNDTYIWKLPSGWTGTSTTNSITVMPDNSGGTISVFAINSCGDSTPVRSLNVVGDTVVPYANVTNLPDILADCEVTILTPPKATDNCKGVISGTTTTTLPISSNTTITWTYDDGNGNTSTQTQNVIINDVTAPIADVANLPDVHVECAITILNIHIPTATDNCKGVIQGKPTVTLPITSTAIITWTYDDGNGNVSTQTQKVFIKDVTIPVADSANLADVHAECEVTTLAPPTATDNCKGTITGTTTATFPISSNTTVTWTYDDGNGNTSTQTQKVFIKDATAPVADTANLTDIHAECEVTALTLPTATDNCKGIITGTTPTTLPISSSTTVTWTYDDGNGNTSTQTQKVFIKDATAPVADAANLTDIHAECEVTALTLPTATDNCKGVITGTTTTTLPISSSTNITWIYDDGNGNISTQIQIVTIKDTTAPVPDVVNLGDITSECEVTTLTPPTATDNCKGVITGTPTTTLPITSTATVIWTYNDGNGNTSTQIQKVIITNLDSSIALIASNILKANITGNYTYQWIDCGNNNNAIAGAVNQTYTVIKSGDYAVQIRSSIGCSVTSACVNITITGIPDVQQNEWNAYPNPTKGAFTISTTKNQNHARVEVFSPIGALIYTTNFSGKQTTLHLEDYPSGVYFIKLNQHTVLQVVKD